MIYRTPMTRSIRYRSVNDILYGLSKEMYVIGGASMCAEELNKFEVFCPEYETLSDDWTLDFGPNRREAVIRWLVEGRPQFAKQHPDLFVVCIIDPKTGQRSHKFLFE